VILEYFDPGIPAVVLFSGFGKRSFLMIRMPTARVCYLTVELYPRATARFAGATVG
jgi:hypothetical protein